MYKKRFKQWKVRKHHDQREMRAAARKIFEHTVMGKAFALSIRGKDADFDEVFDYWARKKAPFEDVLIRRARSITPETVKCFTPLQSPSRTLEIPSIPEHLLFALQNYIFGSFDAGKWEVVEAEPSLNFFIDQCSLALNLFIRKRSVEGGQVLNRAFAVIDTLLNSEHPSTFRSLFSFTSNFIHHGRSEIALAMLRKVFAAAGAILGKNHPFKTICKCLVSMEQIYEASREDMLITSLRKMGECFEQVFGRTDWVTLYCRLDFIARIEDKGEIKTAERMLQEILCDCESSLGKHDHKTLDVRHSLGINWYEQGNFVRAKEAFQCLLSDIPPSDDSSLKANCLEWLAWSQYQLGDTRGAMASMRETICLILAGEVSYDDVVTCRMMLYLEEWLDELGESDSAAQVQEMWKMRLSTQDSMQVDYL